MPPSAFTTAEPTIGPWANPGLAWITHRRINTPSNALNPLVLFMTLPFAPILGNRRINAPHHPPPANDTHPAWQRSILRATLPVGCMRLIGCRKREIDAWSIGYGFSARGGSREAKKSEPNSIR